jgi:hypothetical protein
VTVPEEAEAPARGELIPRRGVTEQEAPDPRGLRLLLNPLVGGVATTAGGVVGLLLLSIASDCSPFFGGCAEWIFLAPMFTGGWIAGSLTVYGMGNWLNGQGRLAPTMIGGALGTGAAIGLYAATRGEAWFIVLLPAIGAVLGYELSNSYERSKPEQGNEASARLQLMPVVGRTPEGGFLGGLAGRF